MHTTLKPTTKRFSVGEIDEPVHYIGPDSAAVLQQYVPTGLTRLSLELVTPRIVMFSECI